MRSYHSFAHESSLLHVIVASALALKSLAMPEGSMAVKDATFIPGANTFIAFAMHEMYNLPICTLGYTRLLSTAQCAVMLGWHDLCHGMIK